jgi:hypothetical protein
MRTYTPAPRIIPTPDSVTSGRPRSLLRVGLGVCCSMVLILFSILFAGIPRIGIGRLI